MALGPRMGHGWFAPEHDRSRSHHASARPSWHGPRRRGSHRGVSRLAPALWRVSSHPANNLGTRPGSSRLLNHPGYFQLGARGTGGCDRRGAGT
jgi:hypothetical protein